MTDHKRVWLPGIAAVVALVLGAAILIAPHLQRPSYNNRGYCRGNLCQIGAALLQYHQDFGYFTPAFLPDETGKPAHSWRVLILPYLGERERELYSRYRFDQPWNSPENSTLLEEMPSVYSCLYYSEDFHSNYAVPVGIGTAFEPGKRIRQRDIDDGSPNVLLVVELTRPVSWMSPVDIDTDRFVAGYEDLKSNANPYRHRTGRLHLLADGNTAHVPYGVDPVELKKSLIIDDGGKVPRRRQ